LPSPQTGEQAAEQPTAATADRKGPRQLAASLRDRALSPKARQALLASLLTKLASRKVEQVEASPQPEPPAAGSLSREYIQAQIAEIVPLVMECYEMELAQAPSLAGNLKVRFKIIGDEEYGGLVVESQILKESSLVDQAGLVECVRETMYALRLHAPEGGGEVTVTYPFKFQSSE
jgi:hypothetical protein